MTRRLSRPLPLIMRLTVAALLMAAPEPAAGQFGAGIGKDSPETGTWWSVTVGAAGARLTCDLCDPARELGPWADLAFGTHASSSLRVGLEGGAWTHEDDDVRESLYRAGLVAHLRPRAASGLYLLGGFGWLGYRAGSFGCDMLRFSVGAGWDLPFGDRWAVGNSLTIDAASFGSLKNGDVTVARGVGLSVMRLGVHLRRR